MPLNGEPIKGWGVISPAQQANLIAINILTVEDLAAVNDEGCRRIGMGAAELRDKAKAWLSQMADKGPLTQENALLKGENVALKGENETLKARVKELSERLELVQRGEMAINAYAPTMPRDDGIAASDILEQPEAPRRGRPRKIAEAVAGEI
jgi:polyhydroxyalkanoate synthesis regulator phasin